MPYWQLFYHIVWATKHREPLLTPDIELIVYEILHTKASGLGGVVFAINGIVDHVHMVVAIPPKIAVATFIGQVKAVAATKFNKSKARALPLYWQDEYGIFSFDAKRLPYVVTYVERQKIHHANRDLIPSLERMDGDVGIKHLREPTATYLVGEEIWRREMFDLEAPAD